MTLSVAIAGHRALAATFVRLREAMLQERSNGMARGLDDLLYTLWAVTVLCQTTRNKRALNCTCHIYGRGRGFPCPLCHGVVRGRFQHKSPGLRARGFGFRRGIEAVELTRIGLPYIRTPLRIISSGPLGGHPRTRAENVCAFVPFFFG